METVKFDPGMGEFAENFNEYINDLYSQLLSLGSIAKKRIKFKMSSPKIERMMKNNLGFYNGCLLWAYYIYNENVSSPKEISENYFLYLSKEQLENYDYMCQINFMDNYFDSYERDLLYYTGKKFETPEQWRKITEAYSEFLELNKGFSTAKYTSDIKLPEVLQNKKIDVDIKAAIDNAIEKKDLTLLLSVDIFN